MNDQNVITILRSHSIKVAFLVIKNILPGSIQEANLIGLRHCASVDPAEPDAISPLKTPAGFTSGLPYRQRWTLR